MTRSHPALPFAISVLAALAAGSAVAAWPRDPSDLPIAVGPGSTAERPAVVADRQGGAMILWAQTSGRHEIRAQRISRNAELLWPQGGAPVCVTAQRPKGLVYLGDGLGGCFLAWEDSTLDDGDVYAQHITVDGTTWPVANGAGLAVCTAAQEQLFPWMALDGLDGVILTWMDRRGAAGLEDVYAQRVRSNGAIAWTADGTPVCAAYNPQVYPTVAGTGAGDAILAWGDARSGLDYDLYAQRVDSTGAAQWTLDGLQEAATFGNQGLPFALPDGVGGAIVIYHETSFGEVNLRAQRIAATGAALWVSTGAPLPTDPGDQYLRDALADGSRGAFVLYELDATPIEPGDPVKPIDFYVQHLGPNGNILLGAPGARLTLSAGSFDRFWPPAFAPDGQGGIIACWAEQRAGPMKVYAQRISSNGERLWGEQGVLVSIAPGDQRRPAIASDGAGGAIIAWEDDRYDPSGDIFAQRVLADGRVGFPPEPSPSPSADIVVYPNPAKSASTVHFVIPDPTVSSVSIHDMTGRLVSNIPLGAHATGAATTVDWVITDQHGGQPRPGIYFARAQSAQGSWKTRFVIMP